MTAHCQPLCHLVPTALEVVFGLSLSALGYAFTRSYLTDLLSRIATGMEAFARTVGWLLRK